MKIGLLTSSRADYSIYFPLIKKLLADSFFELEIIAFGTHLSKEFGYTVDQIERDGMTVKHKISVLPKGDGPKFIAQNMGEVIIEFASFWEVNKFDLVFCLGDRFEMFSAVAAGVPFNVKFAHLYGGEQTTGAIDDCFRHSMTHMSSYHFTSCKEYTDRVVRLIEKSNTVYNVGALSYDNFKSLNLLSIDEFSNKYKIDLNIPTILITVHPETVAYKKNEQFANELFTAFSKINQYQLLITMPNSDTNNNYLRSTFEKLSTEFENIFTVESLGTIGYLSAMKHSAFMLGNTSSGFVEAAWFPKKVINIGDRQNGRVITPNILNCEIQADKILDKVTECEKLNLLEFKNIYGDGNSANEICEIIKNNL